MSVLIAHAAATWFMVGLIWTIQSVHYPLFVRVGPPSFERYESEHTHRMARLLAIPAGLEVGTGLALVWTRPEGLGLTPVLMSGALLAIIWVTTAVVQVPLHKRLTAGYDRSVVLRLVKSNWLRTGVWTARGVLVTTMLAA
jgi:hypothetical protein